MLYNVNHSNEALEILKKYCLFKYLLLLVK